MTAGAINKEIAKIDSRISELCDLLIADGRGNVPLAELIRNPTDDVTQEAASLQDRRFSLQFETKQRYGPGLVGELPRKYGPTI